MCRQRRRGGSLVVTRIRINDGQEVEDGVEKERVGLINGTSSWAREEEEVRQPLLDGG